MYVRHHEGTDDQYIEGIVKPERFRDFSIESPVAARFLGAI